jgi:ion channel-forming bestrophin family protein
MLLLRHLTTIGWLLKSQVRGESSDYETQVLEVMLKGTPDHDWLMRRYSQANRCVGVTSRMRQVCASLLDKTFRNDYYYPTAIHPLLEERITAIEAVIGGCERLFKSPIPPTYSRHLSRVLSVWILFMPIALVASGMSMLGVVMATMISTYVLVGIDEVGMEIEHCFPLLPLQQMAHAVQEGARNEFHVGELSLPAVPSAKDCKSKSRRVLDGRNKKQKMQSKGRATIGATDKSNTQTNGDVSYSKVAATNRELNLAMDASLINNPRNSTTTSCAQP